MENYCLCILGARWLCELRAGEDGVWASVAGACGSGGIGGGMACTFLGRLWQGAGVRPSAWLHARKPGQS